MYTKEEVYQNTLEYFHGNKFLTDIWLSKYTLKDKENNFYEKTPDERFKKIASEITRIEHLYGTFHEYNESDFYNLIKDFTYFIPGGSILYGVANNHFLSSLGNCFVIGNEVDSYGSICLTDQEQIQLMKRRGGVGHDLSHLRPEKSTVNGCATTSTGAFSFMDRYSNSTREVAQDGRRGALMLSAHIKHPDILKFIQSKDDLNKITGANISVKIDDDFVNSVLKKTTYLQTFPINGDHSKVIKEVNAKELWDKIIYQAWKSAEPGVLFWDKIIGESPADCYDGFKTVSTNPCGEIPLCPYDSCRLGHINFYAFVINAFTPQAYFDMNKFNETCVLVLRFMDNIIDLEKEKIEKIITTIESSLEDEEIKHIELNLWKKVLNKLQLGRRTGIGFMGLADTLAALGMKYGTEESNKFAIDLQVKLATNIYKESIQLAKERGSFPIWDIKKEELNPFVNRILRKLSREQSTKEKYLEYGRRNISCLTIAPTGTTSLLANKEGVSSGIEPVFELFYKRRRKVNDGESKVDFTDKQGDRWQWYNVIHPPFKQWYNRTYRNRFYGGKEIEEFDENTLNSLILTSPWEGSIASQIDIFSKIHLQGKLQKWVDHSISVTHNLPKDTTPEQVSEYYLEAWKSGCKGITIYREGSRQGVLVKDNNDFVQKDFHYIDAQKRPEILPCDVHSLYSLKEKWFVIIGLLEDKPYEIFVIKENKLPQLKGEKLLKGKVIKRKKKIYDLIVYSESGVETIKDIVSLMESDDDRSNTKHFSLDLRHRINPKFIADIIDSQPKDITSFEKAVTRVLKKYIPNGEVSTNICPHCGEQKLVYISGCNYCKNCGYSTCN